MSVIVIEDGFEYIVTTSPSGTVTKRLKDSLDTGSDIQDPVTLTVLEFRRRFTLAEKAAIYAAADSEVLIKIWLDDLAAASFVRLEDPDIIQGVQGLVAAGILTEERAHEILAT